MSDYLGQCLCGAVRITASVSAGAADGPILRACHCDMCRQHTSSMYMSLEFDQASIQIRGPATSYASSDWAERGFCATCGSTLWYGLRKSGAKYLAAGLFPDAANATMSTEFFSDVCPSGYALAGQHPKLTTQQTLALFAPDEGEAP